MSTSTRGRPPKFKREFIEQAAKLCLLGATDFEIADFFGVSVRTIHRWKHDNPDFCHSIKSGKEAADDRVERSLYQLATGFHFKEQQAFKVKQGQFREKIELVEVERFALPETPAAIFWLKNRRSDQWRDKQEHTHAGELTVTTKEQRDAAVAAATRADT